MSISQHILIESYWVAGLFACCRLHVLVFLQVLWLYPICLHSQMHSFMYVCMHACMHARLHSCMHACMCARLGV